MTNLTASPNAYRDSAVLSASPEQLVVMLYDGAQRFLRQANAAMREGDIQRAHNVLRRAELIVGHLDGTLDHERGQPVAAGLHSIYTFCLAHLNRARMEQDPAKLDQVGTLLGELRESWAEIARA